MYNCLKWRHCTSDISWLVIHVYGYCLLIVINSGQMCVRETTVFIVSLLFECLYGRKV